jgi:hypothetical protein
LHKALEREDDMAKSADDEGQKNRPGRQPEALANFAATSRSRKKVSPTGGRHDTPETAAVPTDPDRKADAATKVLREGVLKTDQGADEAIEALPDRTRKP